MSYKSNYNNNDDDDDDDDEDDDDDDEDDDDDDDEDDDDDDDDKATTRLKMETSLKTKVAVLSWPASQGGQLYKNIYRRIYNQRKNI